MYKIDLRLVGNDPKTFCLNSLSPIFCINLGGSDSGSNSGDMVTQEDTIFVSGMDTQCDEEEISRHFGQIGLIKKDKRTQKPKIWIYKDKASGSSKGEATVTFEDPHTAQSAIQWFNGQDFNGSSISVSLAQRPSNNFDRKGSFGGGGGGRGGGPGNLFCDSNVNKK